MGDVFWGFRSHVPTVVLRLLGSQALIFPSCFCSHVPSCSSPRLFLPRWHQGCVQSPVPALAFKPCASSGPSSSFGSQISVFRGVVGLFVFLFGFNSLFFGARRPASKTLSFVLLTAASTYLEVCDLGEPWHSFFISVFPVGCLARFQSLQRGRNTALAATCLLSGRFLALCFTL